MGGHHFVFFSILSIWTYCFTLASIPLFKICGQYGYDPVHARCLLLPCRKCSLTSQISIHPPALIEGLGSGVPTIIVVISYALVYKNLSQKEESEEATSIKRAVLILSVSYLIFILPNAFTGYLPYEVSSWAFIGTLLDCWYWMIYLVNFFIYIIFWRRIRTGVHIFFKEIADLFYNGNALVTSRIAEPVTSSLIFPPTIIGR